MSPSRSFLTALATNGLSEIVQKLSRVAVILVVARVMEAEAIGLAAAAIAAGDILKSFTENGVVQRIIAASARDLPGVVATGRRLFTGWCVALFGLQCGVAACIWAWTGGALVPLMMGLLALEYLVMPAGIVNCALAMRAGKLTGTAAVAGGQVVAANIATALMAAIWPVPMALILPRVLTAPLWLWGMRRLHPVRIMGDTRAPVAPFVGFGACILGSEIVKALRLQIDKLLIGLLLGAEALGIYFFAFNAGLGLATSASVAFARVVFPRIAQAADRGGAAREATWLATCLTAPVIIAQALLAPVYVPLLFGEDWAFISDTVSILCLAALPAMLWSGTAQWYRAEDRPGVEFRVTLVMTCALAASTWLLAPHGIEAIAWGYLAVSTVIQLAASLPLIAPRSLRSA
ncbi:oligosaccharide flippase family protein [Roseobacter sp. HKCCA0434]|uniref:oligosaccharide flippase family protein n=1 Tax=Roseobacter sp. HKCCA0434 TaxID=3079297 RepID=UPI002905EDB0|nr:oligosaccharide flippase family protein [Roseobacter sp. HKCCA0434]